MTTYVTIQGVRKRGFTVRAKMKGTVNSVAISGDETYTARNGDTYITRNGDTYVAHNHTPTYSQIRVIQFVRKRTFVVQAKINHQ